MQILKNQSIYMSNLISYKSHVKKEKILDLIDYVANNLKNIGIKIRDKFIITTDFEVGADGLCGIEMIIPIDGNIESNEYYTFKPIFRLTNAVSIRHEYNVDLLPFTEDKLIQYIKDNNYEAITKPYYVIMRYNKDYPNDSIIDVYIGTNYNIL